VAERTFSELPDASGRFVLGATVSRFTPAISERPLMVQCLHEARQGKPMNGQTAFPKGEAYKYARLIHLKDGIMKLRSGYSKGGTGWCAGSLD
jgi:hypothetical protein